MNIRRSDATPRYPRAIWPLDPPHDGEPKPAEKIIGKVDAYPCLLKIWEPQRKPAVGGIIWHPYQGGCWVKFELLDARRPPAGLRLRDF